MENNKVWQEVYSEEIEKRVGTFLNKVVNEKIDISTHEMAYTLFTIKSLIQQFKFLAEFPFTEDNLFISLVHRHIYALRALFYVPLEQESLILENYSFEVFKSTQASAVIEAILIDLDSIWSSIRENELLNTYNAIDKEIFELQSTMVELQDKYLNTTVDNFIGWAGETEEIIKKMRKKCFNTKWN